MESLMPTVIGAFFVIAAFTLFWRRDESLFALVIFSSIFEGASMTSGGTLGLQPFYFVALIFVVQTALISGDNSGLETFRGRSVLLLFGAAAIVSAFTLPFVFAGIPIYDKSIGIDDGLLYKLPLAFSMSNISQTVFLGINILLVLSAGRRFCKSDAPIRAFHFTFYFLFTVILSQVLCSALGLQFPDKLFLNNPGYVFQDTHEGGLALRAPGTFSESSFAGAVLSMYCAAFLADFVKNGVGVIRVLLAVAALFLVRSTSSFLVVPLVLTLLFLWNPVISSRGFIRIKSLRRLTILLLSVGLCVAFVLISSIGRAAVLSVAEKGDTSSFVNRTAADLYALQVLGLSKGLGVGLGSNRPSSLIASLLSNTGVIGCLVFLVMYVLIASNSRGRLSWLRWAALGLLFDMALGIPDIAFSPLWVVLALTVRMQTSHHFSPVFSHDRQLVQR
jgi:hypothetical protein